MGPRDLLAFAKSPSGTVGSLFRVPSSLFSISVPGSQSLFLVSLAFPATEAPARTTTEMWNDELNKELGTRNPEQRTGNERAPILRTRLGGHGKDSRVSNQGPRRSRTPSTPNQNSCP
jgi:hypothetical protein